jgi:uncharacterized membrane protein
LILCVAIGQKLIRGNGWIRSDFYRGLDLAMTAFGLGVVHCYDLRKLGATELLSNASFAAKVGAAATFVLIAFCVLLVVLSIHQDWQSRDDHPRGQLIWLGLIANSVGFALLGSLVLVKEV